MKKTGKTDQDTATGVPDPAAHGQGGDRADRLVRKDLFDRVIARSGVKPRHARQVVEAMLLELGDMLDEANTLQLQPLGTLKVQRRKHVEDGEVLITRLKRKKPGADPNDPLAAQPE